MNTSARALIADPPKPPRIGEVTLRALRPDEVLIRSSLSGFSTGTDRWVMTGQFEWGDFTYPLIPGYQVAGTVEAVGADVTGFDVGQPVVAVSATGVTGVETGWGCHASAVISTAQNVFDATGVPEVSSAFVISAQVGYNAASRLAGSPGESVCVIGDGIIGASAALAAHARGFRVLLQGRHDERLAPFEGTGISTRNARAAGADPLADWGPVAVIDTVQNDDAFAGYIDALESGRGQIVYSGHSPNGVRHWGDMAALQQREMRADFVAGWTPDRIVATLDSMRSGALDLTAFVSHVAMSMDAVRELARTVAEGKLGAVAAAIDWRTV
ncbi:alcohol dehydrogenase catalytic domain-containing protein [Microbacterium aquimaris]|uniref:alcohol dehydrogenase catalytic domain-containing protein n=1 Tax=Microbacterium aquimaris TaxID=459816 RepID=UPI0039062ECB